MIYHVIQYPLVLIIVHHRGTKEIKEEELYSSVSWITFMTKKMGARDEKKKNKTPIRINKYYVFSTKYSSDKAY